MVEAAEANFDELKRKDCVFVAEWLKTKGLHKLCSVFDSDTIYRSQLLWRTQCIYEYFNTFCDDAYVGV